MANKKLSQLPAAIQVLDTDEMYLNQTNVSKKATALQLKGTFTNGKLLYSILSGVTEASDASQIDITIDNYSPLLTYDITVSVGTTSLTNGVITWTIPVLTEDALHTIDVIANFVGVMISSDIGFHSVNIYKDWRYRVVSSADPFKNGGLVAKYEMQADMSDTTGNYDGSNPQNLLITSAGKFGNTFEQVNNKHGCYSAYWSPMTTFSISFWGYYVDENSFALQAASKIGTWGRFAFHTFSNNNFKIGTDTATAYISTTGSLVNGWNHIVATIAGTTMKVYINNVLEVTKTVTLSLGMEDLEFGDTWGTKTFKDELDQGEIYDYVLSAENIDVLFNQNELLPLFN